MDIAPKLDQLEEKFAGEWSENRETIIKYMTPLHKKMLEESSETFHRFVTEVGPRFGGVYIPFLFWSLLSRFYEDPDERIYVQKMIEYFANSDFEEEDQRKMKSMLIVYFKLEKEFELDKLIALVLGKSHLSVQEYFQKLLSFVDKNQSATQMYCEKFDLLRFKFPDFELMAKPLTQL
jgi:hypothetical protein